MTAAWTEMLLLEAIRDVLDPETGVNLVDLGLIYGVVFDPATARVDVRMTLTTPACPASGVMVQGVERRLRRIPEVRDVSVQLVFEPRWTPERITDDGRIALGW